MWRFHVSNGLRNGLQQNTEANLTQYIANFPRGRAFRIGPHVVIKRRKDGKIEIQAPEEMKIEPIGETTRTVRVRYLPTGDESDRSD